MTTLINTLALAIGGSLAASILFKVTVTTALALAGARLARRSPASVRHVLLAASFAILLVLPIAASLIPPVRIALPVTAPARTVSRFSQTLTDANTSTTTTNGRPTEAVLVSESAPLSPWLLLPAAWLVGALLFLMPVFGGLWQTRSLRRSGLPWRRGQVLVDGLAIETGIHRRVAVLLHESVPGPMTYGVAQPIVMLPMDAQTWPDEELNRAIIHELEHVRRGDWISRCLARTACAVYWFHPLVWAAWRQFVLEAERACDDAVLRRGEATAYADQLVVLAQRLLSERNPPLLAMANRYDLAKRVSSLLDSRQRRGRAGVYWVGLACTASALLVMTISPIHLVATQAQATVDKEKFEVASIKPCKEEPDTGGQRRAEYRATPGRVNIDCLPLARIIFFAYAGIGNMDSPLLNDHPSNPDHVRGGPGWLRTDKFSIEATTEGTPDRTIMMGPMLRNLLKERFQLKTHRESEEVPMYALVVAKDGLKIKPLADGGCTSFAAAQGLDRDAIMALNTSSKPVCGNYTSLGDGVNRSWWLGGEGLTKFANQVLSSVLDRYVMDKTGVDGVFNIHLEFGLDESIKVGVFGGRGVNAPPPGIEKGPSIFTALEEQLGLRLEKTRGPREYLVVDSVEKPSGL